MTDTHGIRVKVRRSGNGRVLPLPASLAAAFEIDAGEAYVVSVTSDTISYRRVVGEPQGRWTGEGRDAVYHPVAVGFLASERVATVLDNWDF